MSLAQEISSQKGTGKLFAAHPSAAHAALQTNYICVQLMSNATKN
jgi:hypothetical protein